MGTVDDAVGWLAQQAPAMEKMLAELVVVNSFTSNVAGGRKVGELLRAHVFDEGLEASVKASTRFADHLVFTSKRARVTRQGGVALIGHHDTVFPPGTFEGYRRDGDLARGPGVLDMKGGLVVMGWALKALAHAKLLDGLPPIVVVVVGDEEVGSPEGQLILRDAIDGVSAALVFEAGRAADAIITRRKGTGGMTAVANGRAAHAGNAHKEGKNAIWALARFVDRVQGLTDYERGTTVNVGTITGGTSKNTVPDRAEAKLDLRFESRADAEALVAAVGRAAEEVARGLEGTSIAVEGGIARLPLERTADSGALRDAYAACARASGLGDGEASLIGGGSDASTAHAMGIPAIDGLGPRGAGFHTHDERVEIATLVPKAQALARFLAGRR